MDKQNVENAIPRPQTPILDRRRAQRARRQENVLKSIFYKNDIRKSKVSKIPLFLPRFFSKHNTSRAFQSQFLKVIEPKI